MEHIDDIEGRLKRLNAARDTASSEEVRAAIGERMALLGVTRAVGQSIQGIDDLALHSTSDDEVLSIMDVLIDAAPVWETLSRFIDRLADTREGQVYDVGDVLAASSAHLMMWNFWAISLDMLMTQTVAGAGLPDTLRQRVADARVRWDAIGSGQA